MNQFIDEARKAGHSDQEIQQFLSQNHPESMNEATNYMQTPQSQQQSGGNNWNDLVTQATQVAKQYGLNPAVMAGQMALESGRGSSNFATQRNNLFGYQAYDSNPDAAKTYSSPMDSMVDYAKLITQDPRYSSALQYTNDPIRQIYEIRKAGYATDPNYVQKVVNTPEFTQLAQPYYQNQNAGQ